MNAKAVVLPFGNISIRQDMRSQAITSDSEFLYRTIREEYAAQKQSIKALELGTGNGIVSIMLSLSDKKWDITAIEAQVSLFLMAKENIKQSNSNVRLCLADLRKPDLTLHSSFYDPVFANPPYYSLAKVRISPFPSRALARYEVLCDMKDVLTTVKKTLHPQGKGYLLYPLVRSAEFRKTAESCGLQVIGELPEQQKHTNKAKQLFIVAHPYKESEES